MLGRQKFLSTGKCKSMCVYGENEKKIIYFYHGLCVWWKREKKRQNMR